MLKEAAAGGNIGAEATLWLNRYYSRSNRYMGWVFKVICGCLKLFLFYRALLFFELTFKEILDNLKEKRDINMKNIFNTAYEGSVKKYHNWAVQKLFMVKYNLLILFLILKRQTLIFKSIYIFLLQFYKNFQTIIFFLQVICQLSPTFPQIISSLGLENSDCFEEKMTLFNDSLHVIRCAIDSFFIDNILFCAS